MVSFIQRHDLDVFIHHLCWLFLMLKVKKATAIIIPNTSAPQKNANKLLEILSSWFTVFIWSAGIFPPIQMKIITNYYLQLYNRSYLSRAWFSYSHVYRLKQCFIRRTPFVTSGSEKLSLVHTSFVIRRNHDRNRQERFSNDCRKTETKAITPTNHNRTRQRDEQITIPSNYL